MVIGVALALAMKMLSTFGEEIKVMMALKKSNIYTLVGMYLKWGEYKSRHSCLSSKKKA